MMNALEIVLAVLLCLVSVLLIVVIMLQSGKEAGLSSALAGVGMGPHLLGPARGPGV